MNRNYRLAWNEGSQSWVAVQETSKGRSKRPGGSRLLALIVALCLSSSALAFTTEITDGVVTTGESVNGTQWVKNGGVANESSIFGGGSQIVDVGGQANDTSIDGGSQEVLGVANRSVVTRGVISVAGGGVLDAASVGYDGHLIAQDGSMVSRAVIANNGFLYAENGSQVIATTINSGGLLEGYTGSVVNGTTVTAGGILRVWGEVNDTAVTPGGYLSARGGSTVSRTVVDGGTMYVLADAQVRATTITGGGLLEAFVDGRVNDTQLNNGGVLIAYEGSFVHGTTVSAGGILTAWGEIGDTTLKDGGVIEISPYAVHLTTLTGITTIEGSGQLRGIEGLPFSSLANDGVLRINRDSDTSYDFSISGSGSLVKAGTNTLTLTGVSTYTGGTVIEEGTLALSGNGNLASGVSGTQGATLALSDGANFSGTVHTVELAVDGTSSWTVHGDQSIGGIHGDGAIRLEPGSTLSVDPAHVQGATFSGELSGSGTLVKTGQHTQTLSGVSTHTGGTRIDEGTLALSGAGNLASGVSGTQGATLALSDGANFSGTVHTVELAVDSTSSWTVHGDQSIGGIHGDGAIRLTSGSTLSIDPAHVQGAAFSGELSGDGNLVKNGDGVQKLVGAQALAYTGNTTINLGVLSFDVDDATAASLNKTVILNGGWLDLSDSSTQTDWTHLVIVDQSPGRGGVIGAGDVVRLGDGFFNAGIGSDGEGGKDGVYVVKVGTGETVIGGANKLYVGATRIDEGVLTVSQDGHMGNVATAREVVLNGGNLKLAGSFETQRNLQLNQSGRLDVTAGNSVGWNGSVIDAAGDKTLSKGGAGTLSLDGQVNVGQLRVEEGELRLTSSAVVQAQGDALTLAGANRMAVLVDGAALRSATGDLLVADGATNAGNELVVKNTSISQPTGVAPGHGALINVKNGSNLNVYVNNAILSGDIHYDSSSSGTFALGNHSQLTGKIDAVALSIDASSQWQMSADSQLTTLTNNGQIVFQAQATTPAAQKDFAAKTLTVNRLHGGAGSEIVLNAWLGDANGGSADRLVIDGGTVTGGTTLAINKLGGLGAATVGDGIIVVEAMNGADTTAQSSKNGFSLKGGKVASGAYEYYLFAADAQGMGENWYLRTQTEDGGQTTLRSETSLQATVASAARGLSGLSLDVPAHDEAVWARVLGDQVDQHSQGTLNANYDGEQSGLQVGADILRNTSESGVKHVVGIYAGTLAGRYDVRGNAGGVSNRAVGSLHVNAQTLGTYASLRTARGFYVNGTVQGMHFTGATQGDAQVSQRGSGLALALEAGMPLAIDEQWTLVPQARLAYQRLDVEDTHVDQTSIRTDAAAALEVSAGARLEWGDAASAWRPWVSFNVARQRKAHDQVALGTATTQTEFDTVFGGTSLVASAGFTYRIKDRVYATAQVVHSANVSGPTSRHTQAGVSVNFSF